MIDIPKKVRVVEVGPRDGLQNEPDAIAFAEKVRFIEALIAAGVSAVEVGAFVRPDVVPQMAETGRIVEALSGNERVLAGDVELIALVPNEHGLQNARQAGVRSIGVLTAASDAFNLANIRMSVDESLTQIARVVERARAEGLKVRGYLSTCWWCPFCGKVDPRAVERAMLRLLDYGCDEVLVADTVGAATPLEVRSLLLRLLEHCPAERLAVHFHATRGTAMVNTLVSLQLGIATVDSSAGGLGGCPFAPGAAGNLATEELIYTLDGMGVETGIDVDAVRAATLRMEDVLGRQLPSRYLRAGPFEPRGGYGCGS